MIEHHPHRPFPHFRGIPRSCVHRSILSKDGASGKHGVVQSVVGDFFGVHIPLNQAYKIMNLEGDSESLDANGLTVDPQFLGSRTDDRTTGSIHGIDSENLRPSNLVFATVDGMVDELFGYFSECEQSPRSLFLISNAARKFPLLREVVQNRWGKIPYTLEYEKEAVLGAA